MNKNLLIKIFVIPIRYVFIICLIAFPLVTYCLNFLDSISILSFISYFLSAYALITLCTSFPSIKNYYRYYIKEENLSIIKLTKKIMYMHEYSKKYWDDKNFRVVVSLYTGVLVNFIYAIYRCSTGYIAKSSWFFAIGSYYLIFSIIRFILIQNIKLSEIDKKNRKIFEYKTYRICGIMMLLLNLAMIGMIIQMIYKNETFYYNGPLIYISALYTFYSVIIAIMEVVRYRKIDNEILRAAKNLNLAGAIMSILTLQTAMLYTFGEVGSSNQVMNTITGSLVSILVIIIAIFMIMRGTKLLKIEKINF